MSDSHHAPGDEPSPVTDAERELFDEVLERVLGVLPDELLELFVEVPLIIDDEPSNALLDELGMVDPSLLCGLHSGIPLTQRSVEQSGTMPDTIHIFRDGILNISTDANGTIDETMLELQIRITVLHELGHHFGLDEDDLRQLGYE